MIDLQPENLKWVVEHTEPGAIESVLCFCHYSLNDTLMLEYQDYFKEKGIGMINASPLSMGLLSSRGIPDWHPAPKPLVDACAKAAKYCEEKGYPIEKLAIQFAISNPAITTTLFSSASPVNVLNNIKNAETPIDWEMVKEVQKIIGDQMGVRWNNS